MGNIAWMERLGWSQDHLDDLRFAGYAYIRQGKYDIALPFFEALQILDPNHPYDLQILGAAYLELGQHGTALKYIKKALQIDPNHCPTLLNMMKLLFCMGKKEEALQFARRLAQENDPQTGNLAKAFLLAYE